MKEGSTGIEIVLRNYQRLSVNDYSFFLISLLLPLVSLDYTSIFNLLVSLLIISFIIIIYVSTNSICVCPVFFMSNRFVFKATISQHSRDEEELNPSLRKDVYVITLKKNIDMDKKYRAEKIVSNVYYIVQF